MKRTVVSTEEQNAQRKRKKRKEEKVFQHEINSIRPIELSHLYNKFGRLKEENKTLKKIKIKIRSSQNEEH